MSVEPMLRRKRKNSRRATHEMVLCMAKYGNHGHGSYSRFRSDADVKRAFEAAGAPFDVVVEECRDWNEHVPFFENLLGSTWHVNAPSGSVAIVDMSSGKEEEIVKVEGQGQIVTSTSWHLYEKAEDALNRAIWKADWGEFLSALAAGIASVEAYINQCAERWNKSHPEDLLIDSKATKVSFENKITEWIPKMTGGRKLDRTDKTWQDFVTLQTLRDQEAIHPKKSIVAVTQDELIASINRFSAGVAGLLLRLHVLFGDRVLSRIVRGAFAPNVEPVGHPASDKT